MNKYILLFGLVCILAGCTTKTHNVYKVPQWGAADPQGVREKDGISYSLPRTGFLVTLTVEKTETDKSILYTDNLSTNVVRYARLLGIDQTSIPSTGKTNYAFKSAKIETFSEADPDQIYFVEINKNYQQDQTLLVAMSELGVLTSATSDVKDKRFENIVKVAEIGATLIGKAIGLGGAKNEKDLYEEAKEHLIKKFKEGKSSDNSEYNQKSLDSYLASTEYQKELKETVYDIALFYAELHQKDPRHYYNEIINIRAEKRKMLSDGSRHVTKDGLEALLKEFDKIEQENLAAFTGAKRKKEWEMKFILWPPTWEVSGSQPKKYKQGLIYVDKDLGISLATDSGFASAESSEFELSESRSGKLVSLTVSASPEDQIKIDLDSFTKIKNDGLDRSFRYRIPAKAKATVSEEGDIRSKSYVMVAQFGGVYSIPSTIIGTKGKYDFALYEKTGALKKLDLTSSTPSAESLSGLTTALGTFVPSPDDPESPTAALEQEVSILELEVRKKEAEEKLQEKSFSPSGF